MLLLAAGKNEQPRFSWCAFEGEGGGICQTEKKLAGRFCCSVIASKNKKLGILTKKKSRIFAHNRVSGSYFGYYWLFKNLAKFDPVTLFCRGFFLRLFLSFAYRCMCNRQTSNIAIFILGNLGEHGVLFYARQHFFLFCSTKKRLD